MTKTCNDHEIVKFRAQLREYLNYYLSVMCRTVAYEPTTHLIWPRGERSAIDDVYEFHERNVTRLMEDRKMLGRMLWFCRMRLQVVPGAAIKAPRNDLTKDVFWDDELSQGVLMPIPTSIEYEQSSDGVWHRAACYDTGISINACRQEIYVPQGVVDIEKEKAMLRTPDYAKVPAVFTGLREASNG